MGFGTLFIGFFLLLNITYYAFTDIIVGLVILLALNKLSSVNPYFKWAIIPTAIFSLLGLCELFVEVYTMFFEKLDLTVYHYITGSARYLLLGAFIFLILLGIESVANEVDLPKVSRKARVLIPFSLSVLSFGVIFELPILSLWFDVYTVTALGMLVLIGVILIVILNLSLIYTCYMAICMPEDLVRKPKKSKFEFVNKFREHEDKKEQEYIEYKRNKKKK